jgi:hypothetical protein
MAMKQHSKQTKRGTLQATMQEIVPWQKTCPVIEPQ